MAFVLASTTTTCVLLTLHFLCASAELLPALDKACVGDIGFALEFHLYHETCPLLQNIVFSNVENAVSTDPRMAASLLRLHFHDCFVNGCDASVLLDDKGNFVGEKTAQPNLNSLRGFEVIDQIKAELELACPLTVSCADILAIAARDSVVLSGGPSWDVPVGRKDSLTASKSAATNNIPSPNSTVADLVAKFQNNGLTLNDMVALSGAHTIGKARCSSFIGRIQGAGSTADGGDVNTDFLRSLQQLCSSMENTVVTELDHATPETFDNQYFVNILSGEGLLPSDQALATQNEVTRQIAESYVEDADLFMEDFKSSMLKMGSLMPSTQGEIRKNCRSIN